jgi:hypothetical protein
MLNEICQFIQKFYALIIETEKYAQECLFQDVHANYRPDLLK